MRMSLAHIERQAVFSPTAAALALVAVLIRSGTINAGARRDDSRKKVVSGADGSEETPWKEGLIHRYRWEDGRSRVGETRFWITTIKAGSNPAASPSGFGLVMEFRYEREGRSLAIDRVCRFDRRWRLLRYNSTTRVQEIRNIRSRARVQGWREGDDFVTETRLNDDPEQTTLARLRLPADSHAPILLPQGVELWAIHAPALLGASGKESTFRLAYPYFDRIYDVSATRRGTEKLTLGSETLECTRHDLESRDKQLQESLWLDTSGRLVQYRKGRLRVTLEPDPKPLGEKEADAARRVEESTER